MKTLLIGFIAITLLSGCDFKPNFAELCEKYPNICHEFEEDSWCKKERIKVGFANLKQLKNPMDYQQFQQLIAYEEYAQCMEHASLIEHIKLKEKKSKRINNVLKAKERIKEISQLTRSSNEPHLLYYHWSRYLNENALNKFLKLEGTGALESPALQVYLATHYAKRDREKTLTLLYHALELYKADDDIDIEIFQSISSTLAEKKAFKQAYIWSKVLQLYQPENETITDKSLNTFAQQFTLNQAFLDEVAEVTLSKITQGKFKAP